MVVSVGPDNQIGYRIGPKYWQRLSVLYPPTISASIMGLVSIDNTLPSCQYNKYATKQSAKTGGATLHCSKKQNLCFLLRIT